MRRSPIRTSSLRDSSFGHTERNRHVPDHAFAARFWDAQVQVKLVLSAGIPIAMWHTRGNDDQVVPAGGVALETDLELHRAADDVVDLVEAVGVETGTLPAGRD